MENPKQIDIFTKLSDSLIKSVDEVTEVKELNEAKEVKELNEVKEVTEVKADINEVKEVKETTNESKEKNNETVSEKNSLNGIQENLKLAKNIEKQKQIKRQLDPKIIQWNLDLRNFLLHSNRHWKVKYPLFRANYQGDKTVGYALAKNIVEIPKQYKKLRSLRLLSDKVIASLPAKSFVIKEVLGHAGNRVLCLGWDEQKKVYNDYLHKTKNIAPEKLINYIKRKLSLDSAVIIEELLLGDHTTSGSSASDFSGTPPPDYKVYVVMGKPRQINIYFRLNQGRFECSYTPGWQRIPLTDLYDDLVKLNYNDLPADIKFELPSPETRKKLLNIATKLAKVHDALFVRYDFYIIKDRIVLGEITPLCGGVRNNILKERMLKNLFPSEVRNGFLAATQSNVKIKLQPKPKPQSQPKAKANRPNRSFGLLSRATL